MSKAPELIEQKQASSARGAARVALALCLAQYPDMDLDEVTSGMPEDADDLALLEACQGFDCRVEKCVTHTAYYDIYDLPAAAKERERLAEEAEVNAAAGDNDATQDATTSKPCKNDHEASCSKKTAAPESEKSVSSPEA